MKKEEIKILETKNIETVLLEIAQGQHGSAGSQTRDETEAWIKAKLISLASLSASKRDAREEETLSIARRANNNARIAIILSIIIAIAMIITQFLTTK